MIILRLKEDSVASKNSKGKFFSSRKGKTQILDYSRSGIVVNGKPHFVVSVSKETLCKDEFRNLLKNYKGELVVSEELENDEFVSELIFDNKPYLKKAVFESFYSFLTNGNFRDCNLLIFDENFMFKNKLCGIIPYVKSLTVIVKSNFDYLLWQGSCFAEYGVKPLVLEKEPESLDSFDIIANFNEFADERVVVSVKNQNLSFYPDYRYLQVPDELKILEGYNVKNSLLCAAFKQI